MVFHDSKFIAISMERSLTSISWFGQCQGSKIYLTWRAVWILGFFGHNKAKQILNDFPDDEWTVKFSSTNPEAAPINICHERKLNATVLFLALQLWNNACKCFQKDGRWWHNGQEHESFEDFFRKIQVRKGEFLRENEFQIWFVNSG